MFSDDDGDDLYPNISDDDDIWMDNANVSDDDDHTGADDRCG